MGLLTFRSLLFYLLIIVNSPIGRALSSNTFSYHAWKVDKDYILFYEEPQYGLSIQKGCEQKSSQCGLWKIKPLLKSNLLSEEDLRGGKNPGAALCHKLKLQVVIASDTQGNRQSFCMASDGSLFSSATAYRWAIENGQ